MPEFSPDHVPSGLSEFETGYFAAAEWLAAGYGPKYKNDSSLNREDRAKLLGWGKEDVVKGKRDCAAFVLAHEADLEVYCEESGRDMECAGHDFWLSRNGHGAGFSDRGDHDVFEKLQDAAGEWGEVYCESYRNRLVFTP